MPGLNLNAGTSLTEPHQSLSSPRHGLKNLSLTALKSIPRLNRRPVCLHVVAIVSIFAYVFIYMNLPMFLFPAAGYDDGLYIAHAHYIASGHWLGPYSQFTLMKGPGYPLFLALISLTGIPLALAHSLFYALSVWVLSYTTIKIINSAFFSIAVLEVLLWHFGPHTMRVLREAIVTPQILLVFSLIILALFVFKRTLPRLLSTLLAGLLFGWFWITREDGLIAVPALLVLFACGFHRSYGALGSIKPFFKMLAGFISSYAIVLVAIGSINLSIYNTFSTVDINGTFEKAFEALESVKPDVYIPYVAVPSTSRKKIYRVSPTFSQLRPIIDGPNSPIQIWKKPSCDYYPAVCGDYATGWFMWAFRDSVASHGDYASSFTSDIFYRKVYDEVTNACRSKIISCYHNPIPFMPHVDESQMLHSVASMESALSELSLQTPPPLSGVTSLGSDNQIRDVAKFLKIQNYNLSSTRSTAHLPVVEFAINFRDSMVKLYAEFLPILLLLGISSSLSLAVRSLYSRTYSVAFAIACAAWIAVGCRLVALVLIDISSFPAIFHMYIGYAYPLSCFASLISIFLVGRWMCYFRWDD